MTARAASIRGIQVRPPAVIALLGLAAAMYAWLIFATTFTRHGQFGPDYDTPGTDYMAMHAGIATALRGDLALLFDAERFTAMLNSTYHALLPYPLITRPYVYPPSFLIVLLPFAPFGFRASYLLFQIATAGLLVAALGVAAARRGRAAAIAALALVSPAASVNVLEGQVAFLVAALLVAGTRLLPRRPILAGVVFGLLSIKPQHALLVPVMLVALGAWRTALAACGSALMLAAASAAVFGIATWTAWLHAILNYPAIDSVWDNSVHTCALLLGAGTLGAAVAQGVAMAGGAALVFTAFRRPAGEGVRLAILLAATNLVSPHTGPYDTILQVIAMAILLLEVLPVPPSMAWTFALCVWMVPLLSQPAISPVARFAPVVTVTVLAWLFREATARRAVFDA